MKGSSGLYALGVGLACVIGLILTPSAYWVVRLHAGVLADEWRLSPGDLGRPIVGEPVGLWDEGIAARLEVGGFERALVGAFAGRSDGERLAAIKSMDAESRRLNDAARAVIVVRHWVTWTSARKSPDHRRELVKACRRAILLDPGNAYVWLCMAYALAADQAAESDVGEVLLHAAGLANYSDYVVYESEAITDVFRRARGYRGEFVEQLVLPDSLPTTSNRMLAVVADWVVEQGLANTVLGDATAQTIRRAFLTTRTGRELDAVRAAYQTLRRAILTNPGDSERQRYETGRRVAGYDAYLREIEVTLDRLRGRLDAPRLDRHWLSAEIVARAALLGGLAVSAVFSAFVLLSRPRRHSDRPAFVAAAVGFGIVFWLQRDPVVLVPAAACLGMGHGGLKGWGCLAIAGVAVAGSIWAGVREPAAVMPSVALGLALLPRAPRLASIVFVFPAVVVLLTVAWVVGTVTVPSAVVRGALLATALPGLLSVASSVRPAQVRMAVGMTIAAASVAYLFAVSEETRANEKLRATEASWRYEIERAKAAALLEAGANLGRRARTRTD